MINFFCEEITFNVPHRSKIGRWLHNVLNDYHTLASNINFIFSNDNHLLQINRQYLQHDYYTDIITFQYSEPGEALEADIYISVDRVRENARTARTPFEEELCRVMVHGILHTLGHQDSTPGEKQRMRKLENHYLALRQFE